MVGQMNIFDYSQEAEDLETLPVEEQVGTRRQLLLGCGRDRGPYARLGRVERERRAMTGQYTIDGIHTGDMPCDYAFARYIGQRVGVWNIKDKQTKLGRITGIEPYYTSVMTDDGDELVATPYNLLDESETEHSRISNTERDG